MRELLHIGEIAKLIGVSTKTIRYYHEIGLLAEPKRTEGGYRLYTANDLLRLQHIAEKPGHYKQLFALEERFANLANESEDSPEVERLAEDYARSDELGKLQSMFGTNTALGSRQLENTMMDLASTIISPAQRRFFEEVSCKLSTSESNDYQIKPFGQS